MLNKSVNYLANMKTALYKYYDAGGGLIYAGASGNPSRRMGEHRTKSKWFHQVARCEISWFNSVEDALKAEAEVIAGSRPAFNKNKISCLMKNEYLLQAIQSVGSQKELAARLGVSPQLVQWWTKNTLPPKWVIPVENVTGVPRHKLRGDIYPQEGCNAFNI